jgi:3-methyladenine DNA glycosylase AlkD
MKRAVEYILSHASPGRARRQPSFFKPGYTDTRFVGIRVPVCRRIADELLSDNKTNNIADIAHLLQDNRHEVRIVGLLMMVKLAKKNETRQKTVDLYLENIACVSNWDLVDTSCPEILGNELVAAVKSEFECISQDGENEVDRYMGSLPAWYPRLFNHSDLWLIRISVVSLLALVKQNILFPTYLLLKLQMFRMAQPSFKLFLHGKEYPDGDLLFKAIGWVIRELGKKDKKLLLKMLDENLNIMHTTTIRYAIEKLSSSEQQKYRSKKAALSKVKSEVEEVSIKAQKNKKRKLE